MKPRYTRLYGSALWKAAEAQYALNGHSYHNLPYHICSIYDRADRLGFAYDPDLDEAILAHDVILDGQSDPEIRSADWLDEQRGSPNPKAREFILTTVDHQPISADNRLALLDLENFLTAESRRRSSRLLRDEAARKAGPDFDQHEWVRKTLTYLNGLHDRIHHDLDSGEEIDHREHWNKVRHGIRCTMAVLPLQYAPHPASNIQRYTRDQEAVLQFLAQGDPNPETLAQFAREEDISPDKMPNILIRMSDEGLLICNKNTGETRLTEAGQEWVDRWTAPQEDWLEPTP